MKKKKKNQPNNRPDPTGSGLPPSTDLEAGMDFEASTELEASTDLETDTIAAGADVEAVSEVELESDSLESTEEVLEPEFDGAPVMELAADSIPADDLDPSSLEPMDELFNEMLAHDNETAPEAASLEVSEPMAVEVLAQPEAELSAPDADVLQPLEDIEAPDTMEFGESLDLSSEVATPLAEPEPAPLSFSTADPNWPVATPLEEPVPEEIAPLPDSIAVPLQADVLEAIAPEPPIAAVEEVIPEPQPEPLAPQPALEAVVGSIDRALEAAPPVAGPVETVTQHHHQKQFSQLDDYVVFSLAGADYAVPVRDVAEIGRVPGITRVPNVPEFVRGITNLRGEVVPVLNLPALLGLMESQATARGRVLFLQARAAVSATGLLVDEVKGIQRIQSQQLEQVTGLVDDKVTSVLRGVYGRGDRLLNVLDLEQLFQLQEFRQLETI